MTRRLLRRHMDGPVLGLLLLATVLRLQDLERTSLWYDEAVSWQQSRGSLGQLLQSVSADNYPPLHNLILWLWMPLAGDSEWALRLPSVLFGVLAVWLLFLIGREIGGRRVGLAAAFLLCVSSFHIWYSTEARMYALFCAAGLGFLLCLLHGLNRGTRADLCALFLTSCTFLYCHIYTALAFACIGTALLAEWLFAHRSRQDLHQRLFGCLVAMTLAGLGFLPWFMVLLGRADAVVTGGFWIEVPTGPFLATMAGKLAGSGLLFVILAVLAGLGSLAALTDGSPDKRLAVRLLLAGSLGTFGLAYLISLTLRPILFDRYLIAAWPAVLLLAALGANRLWRLRGLIALAAVSLVLTAPTIAYTLREKPRPDWRAISRIYLAESTTREPLLLYKGFAEPALRYYLGDRPEVRALDTPLWPATVTSGEIWLLVAHATAKEFQIMRTAVPSRYAQTGRWQRFGWGASGLTLLRFSAAQ